MSDTSSIAYNFVKKCLGWQDARYGVGKVIYDDKTSNYLNYTSCDDVFLAVMGWCKRNKKRLTVTYNPAIKDSYMVVIDDGKWSRQSSVLNALMLACIDAQKDIGT
jgi:hypothetical protein